MYPIRVVSSAFWISCKVMAVVLMYPNVYLRLAVQLNSTILLPFVLELFSLLMDDFKSEFIMPSVITTPNSVQLCFLLFLSYF